MTNFVTARPETRSEVPGNRIPPRQAALRARCVHPSGAFEPFAPEAVEQSVAARFEELARRHPRRLAVRTERHSLSYDALNRMANGIAHAVLDRLGEGAEPVALLM